MVAPWLLWACAASTPADPAAQAEAVVKDYIGLLQRGDFEGAMKHLTMVCPETMRDLQLAAKQSADAEVGEAYWDSGLVAVVVPVTAPDAAAGWQFLVRDGKILVGSCSG